MTILRVYDPAECDSAGVPLDWERCRKCAGAGEVVDIVNRDNVGSPHLPQPAYAEIACPSCDGHGSLKAAALDRAGYRAATQVIAPYVIVIDDWRSGAWKHDGYPPAVRSVDAMPVRCEDCGHPMNDGTFEYESVGPLDNGMTLEMSLMVIDQPLAMYDSLRRRLAAGEHIGSGFGIGEFWSPCDEGCRHGAPIRMGVQGVEATVDTRTGDVIDGPRPVGRQTLVEIDGTAGEWAARIDPRYGPVEASWRPVDVRILGWPHDLRPEKLAVLCLRCWASR